MGCNISVVVHFSVCRLELIIQSVDFYFSQEGTKGGWGILAFPGLKKSIRTGSQRQMCGSTVCSDQWTVQ